MIITSISKGTLLIFFIKFLLYFKDDFVKSYFLLHVYLYNPFIFCYNKGHEYWCFLNKTKIKVYQKMFRGSWFKPPIMFCDAFPDFFVWNRGRKPNDVVFIIHVFVQSLIILYYYYNSSILYYYFVLYIITIVFCMITIVYTCRFIYFTQTEMAWDVDYWVI